MSTRSFPSKSPRRFISGRAAAARILVSVIDEGRSLKAVLEEMVSFLKPQERALTSELSYGVLRWLPQLETVLLHLLDRPLRRRDRDIHTLLLIGLYQMLHLAVPDHVALSQTAEAARHLGKDWAVGLVNALMRNLQGQSDAVPGWISSSATAKHAHPLWLLEIIQEAWPEDWSAIVAANNQRPPMTLRVNRRRIDRAAYLERLSSEGIAAVALPFAEQAVRLEKPQDVTNLPGFSGGEVSVQDAAAQLAAPLLELQPGQRVLDACAAPGGKTCHILELQPQLAEVVAVDVDVHRMAALESNLSRLQLVATVRIGDAAIPAMWWDGELFDRILLDAPCSGTGVIRRHPDIKVLRHPQDIPALAERQMALLQALWPLLKPGGMLLYATCSVLPQENSLLTQRFVQMQVNAEHDPIGAPWGRAQAMGRQIVTGEATMDGFYYARLIKRAPD